MTTWQCAIEDAHYFLAKGYDPITAAMRAAECWASPPFIGQWMRGIYDEIKVQA